MTEKYNDYQKYYYKTGRALYDLYCKNCGELIFKKGEKFSTSIFSGDEKCCSNCDATLHRRSNGGQGDRWGLTTKKDEGILPTAKCPDCEDEFKIPLIKHHYITKDVKKHMIEIGKYDAKEVGLLRRMLFVYVCKKCEDKLHGREK